MTTRIVYPDSTTAINKLRKNGIGADTSNNTVVVKGNIGIKLWGAIDYLVNRHKHTWVREGAGTHHTRK